MFECKNFCMPRLLAGHVPKARPSLSGEAGGRQSRFSSFPPAERGGCCLSTGSIFFIHSQPVFYLVFSCFLRARALCARLNSAFFPVNAAFFPVTLLFFRCHPHLCHKKYLAELNKSAKI
jgi:hypothetical protein